MNKKLKHLNDTLLDDTEFAVLENAMKDMDQLDIPIEKGDYIIAMRGNVLSEETQHYYDIIGNYMQELLDVLDKGQTFLNMYETKCEEDGIWLDLLILKKNSPKEIKEMVESFLEKAILEHPMVKF